MKNSIAGPAIAALVGAVVALVAAASGLTLFTASGSTKKLLPATIYIDTFGGGCKITTIPQTIEVYKREIVEWSVVNRCPDATDDVEVRFEAAGDPLDATCVRKDKRRIKCGIKPAADARTYKYKVVSGTFEEDPELEIAP